MYPSPFVQRVWISLQFKGIDYQYIEIDPYRKSQSLTAINPRGLVPALVHGQWGCYESTVLMEYVSSHIQPYSISNLFIAFLWKLLTDLISVGRSRCWSQPVPSRTSVEGTEPSVDRPCTFSPSRSACSILVTSI